MLPTSQRQKPKKRGGKERRVPPSPASPETLSPLAAFFANYYPRFQYNATASAPWEFYRLCDVFGWGRDDPRKVTAHQEFKDALVQQFNVFYGTDVDDLKAWQSLCHVVRIEPIPDGLHACREAVYYSFVDLVDTRTTGAEVGVFESERALSEYTLSTRKFFPRENAHAGSLLRYLLRHIHHPRDGYDSSRRWGKGPRRR